MASGLKLAQVLRWGRANVLFLALLAVGAVLRALTSLAYRPALEYVQDSFDYLGDAQRLVPGVIRPLGYPLFLRLLTPTHRLAAVPAAQHLLGLLIGVMIYALLRRLGARSWLAALGAAPVLLDAYQIYVEQFVLAETLFEFLVVAALVLLIWKEPPPAVAGAAAGGLLAGAVLTRTVGLLLLVPVLAYMAVRRMGIKALAAVAAPAVLLLGVYATAFKATHGRFGLEAYQGYFLAGRVSQFADCRALRLPPEEEMLCDHRPVDQRPGTDWYVWNPGTPLRRPHVPPGTDRNAVARRYAMRIIRNQPGDYLRTVGRDVLHYFAPGRTTGPRDNPVQAWQYRTSFRPDPWQAEHPPADPYVYQWTWPGASVRYGVVVASHGFNLGQVTPRLDRELALWLRDYQRYAFVPGTALLVAMVLAVGAGVGRLPSNLRRHRWVALLLVVSALLLLLAPATNATFDYRYLLPAQTLLVPAGVIGITIVEGRVRAASRRRAQRRHSDGLNRPRAVLRAE